MQLKLRSFDACVTVISGARRKAVRHAKDGGAKFFSVDTAIDRRLRPRAPAEAAGRTGELT
jgi:hypothetical protein